jgi:CDGSH-type Zn-finger protein
MKAGGRCDYKVGLGDLGYQSDLSYFKALQFDKCVIGNHDSTEDGSSSIQKEALTYCGDHWMVFVANATTLLLGFNTNAASESDTTSWITGIMEHLPTTVKNVIFVSHKNGHVFPSAHHPAEASSIYSEIENFSLSNVKIYEVSGHNHNLASAANNLWFISGAGGKSHYSCGTSADWPYCDNSHYGYLRFTIDNQSNITPNFYDISGKILH